MFDKSKKEKSTTAPVNISDCSFVGIHWDAKAVEAINTTAKALLNLTELFKSQNIRIESMLSIGKSSGETCVNGCSFIGDGRVGAGIEMKS